MFEIKCNKCQEVNQFHDRKKGYLLTCSICGEVVKKETKRTTNDVKRIKGEMTTRDKRLLKVILIPMALLGIISGIVIGISAIENFGSNKVADKKEKITVNKKDVSQGVFVQTLYNFSQNYDNLSNEIAKSMIYNDIINFVNENNKLKRWHGQIVYISTTKGGKSGWTTDGVDVMITVFYPKQNFKIDFRMTLSIDSQLAYSLKTLSYGDWIIFNGKIINSDTSVTEWGQMDNPEFRLKLISIHLNVKLMEQVTEKKIQKERQLKKEKETAIKKTKREREESIEWLKRDREKRDRAFQEMLLNEKRERLSKERWERERG